MQWLSFLIAHKNFHDTVIIYYAAIVLVDFEKKKTKKIIGSSAMNYWLTYEFASEM